MTHWVLTEHGRVTRRGSRGWALGRPPTPGNELKFKPFKMHYFIALKHQSITGRPPLGEILYPPLVTVHWTGSAAARRSHWSSIDNGNICILVSGLKLSIQLTTPSCLKNSAIMASITRVSKVTFLEEHNLFEVVTILQAISRQVCHRVVF